MHKAGIIIWISLVLAAGSVAAQPVCGTTGSLAEENIARLLRNKERVRQAGGVTDRAPTYLPVTFRLVANDDGLGRVSPARVMDMLCRVNADFAETDLQFFVRRFTLLNNTLIYSNHTEADALMLALRDPHAINVWLVQDATPAVETIENSIVQGYYTFNDALRDWIVMRRSEANAVSTTLTHELGHFFSLAHPFRGWDNEPYDPDLHGTPAPAASPGGAPTELVSGANCETAADMLCDTPPDYNVGFGWENCDYAGGAQDPQSVLIDPEERLFMSYFGECGRDEYFFSDMQQSIMRQDVLSEDRTYLRETPAAPELSPVAGAAQLIAPGNGSGVAPGAPVTFSWNPVAGATRYLLEVDITPSFVTPLARQLLVEGNSRTVTGLQPDRNYYWRVRPFNNYQTCTEYSDLWIFNTGGVVSTGEIEAVSGWSLHPNPAGPGATLHFRLQATKHFRARLQLHDLTGRPVRDFGTHAFGPGEHRLAFEPLNLPSGAYLFSVQTDAGGRLFRKIILTP